MFCTRLIRPLPLLAFSLLLLLADAPLAAQAPPPPPDSARTLRAARSAQARFESIRRNHLPWTNSRGGGECDERVGRFCLWYGDGDSTWEPPPEPEPVQKARRDLLARLAVAAADFPGDAWVAGQRVRYLLEAEQGAEAVDAARECRSGWWCLALEGYALHGAGDYEGADAAFARALREMPERERRRWSDLSVLLDASEVRSYRRIPEAERAAFEERFWWMAKPLYLLPGNEARSEHYSRHVLDRLQDRAKSTDGIVWGSDLRELLLRYGWPAGWERIRPSNFSRQTDGMVSRYPRGSRSFLPSPRVVADPAGIAAAEWELNAKRARVSYAPAYTPAFAELEHQVGVFTRGDSVVVVAAFDTRSDTLFAEVQELEAGLFLLRDERSAPAMVHGLVSGGDGSFSLTSTPGPTLLSLEVRAPAEKRAARARFGTTLTAIPPHGLALSDVIVLSSTESLPASLAEAVPSARGSLRLRPEERIVLFWEVYGLTARDPFSVGIVMVNENRGLLRRLGERMGMVRQVNPVRVRWQEASETEEPVLPRALELEIPQVSPGHYRIELTVTVPGREPLTASRVVEVVG